MSSKVKRVKTEKPVEVPVKVEEVKVEVKVVEPVVEEKKSRKHVPVTKEGVLEEFDVVLALIDAEVEKSKDVKKKQKGSRVLKGLRKKISSLKTKAQRAMKLKKKKVVDPNAVKSNNGFMKPVRMSPELVAFTGWGDKEILRKDVTKFISEYVKKNSLFDKDDKRKINPDAKLKTLLKGYDEASRTLTYFTIQRYLAPHYVKIV